MPQIRALKTTILLAASVALWPNGNGAAAHTQDPSAAAAGTMTPAPVHKAVVIYPPLLNPGDIAISELRAVGAQKRESIRRKRSLPGTAARGPVTSFIAPGTKVKKATGGDGDELTPTQLTDYLLLCMKDAVTERLKSRCSVTVASDESVLKAAAQLKLNTGALSAEDAEKLCAALDCDAVIIVERPTVQMHDGVQRELVARNDIRLAALRSQSGKFIPTGKNRSRAVKQPRKGAEAGTFSVASSLSTTRAFLKPGYSQEPAELVQLAAGDLASQAIHTLTSGETYPLNAANIRVALAPVPAPPDADMFVADGTRRFTETQAIPMLSTNATEYFRPEIVPLFKSDIVDPLHTEAALKKLGFTVGALWSNPHEPDNHAATTLGRSLNVQYILLARVTDVQGTAFPQHPAENKLSDEPCREAHAEAVGALIRVQDGAILWSGRGEATVTSREVVKADAIAAANRQACQMAEKFALIDLKRKFAQYRSEYLQ
jgi:hypothetical protein